MARGGRGGTVELKIIGDASKVIAEIDKVDHAVARLGPTGNRAQQALQGPIARMQNGLVPASHSVRAGLDAIDGSMSRLPSSAQRLQAAAGTVADRFTGNLGPAGDRVRDSLSRVGVGADDLSGMLGSAVVAGAAAGAAALVAFGASAVQAFTGLAGEVRGFQRAAGASAEESSRFVAVLDDMGVSSEDGAKAIGRLARGLDTNTLAKFGVDVRHAKDGTVDLTGTLLNVADAYSRTTDPAARAELRFAAFGKQGDALIPILEKGRRGLDQFFEGVSDRQILSQEELDKAEDFRLAMDALNDAFTDLKLGVGGDLVPALADLAETSATVIGWVDKLADKVGGLGSVFKAVRMVIDPIGSALSGYRSEMEKIPGTAEYAEAAQRKLADATDAVGHASETNAHHIANEVTKMKDVEAAIRKRTEALDDLLQATMAQLNSGIAYERSLNQLEDANSRVADASKAHTDAIRAHGPSSEQAKAAAEALSRAQLDSRSAYLGVAEAAVRQASDTAAAAGRTLTESEKYAVYRNKLIELKDTLSPGSPLRAALEGYIETLKGVPDQVKTQMMLEVKAVIRSVTPDNVRIGGIGDGEGIEPPGGARLEGRGTPATNEYLRSLNIPPIVSSSFRPGSITSSGNRSLHGIQVPGGALATDYVAPTRQKMMRLAQAFLPVAGQLRELIHTPLGFSIKNGRRVPPIAASNHFDHVHVATYDRGGPVPPGFSFVYNGTGRPETIVAATPAEVRDRLGVGIPPAAAAEHDALRLPDTYAAAGRLPDTYAAAGRRTVHVTVDHPVHITFEVHGDPSAEQLAAMEDTAHRAIARRERELVAELRAEMWA